MLNVRGLSKSFSRAGPKLLHDASMDVSAGQGAMLVAPNGSGKSTLLKLLAGVLLPDSGDILLNGAPIFGQRRTLGYCPSTSVGFYRRLTARQNLHYFGSYYGLSRAEVDASIARVDCFGIDYWQTPSEKLSDGMLQKVKIVRAFLHDPTVALLDEPLNYLDAASRSAFAAWLERWCADGKIPRCFVISQHSAELPPSACRPWTIGKGRLERVPS